MRSLVALLLTILPLLVVAEDDTIDLVVEQEPLLSVWKKVEERCPNTGIRHEVVNVEEPISLKLEDASCRDVLTMLVDFDRGASPSK